MLIQNNKIFPIILIILGLIIFSPHYSYAASYSAGDACATAGAWHQNNDSSGMHFLICDGSTWKSAVFFSSSGDNIRLDDDPATGSAGCIRYSSSTLQYANDCSTWADLGSGGGGASGDYQVFTADGTWTKPSGIAADQMVVVEAWGAGGSGTSNNGGGGGGYNRVYLHAGDLGATVAVTVGTGASGAAGGDSSFGSFLTAYGGGKGGASTAGGGGGIASKGGNGTASQGVGGAYSDGGTWGGGGGGGGNSIYGGGGGNSSGGGKSIYGGGGGAGTSGSGGTSIFGGNGGGPGVAGTAPGGGGGGSNAAGARGEVRVWVLPGGGSGGGGTSALNDLTDVDTTGFADGNVLMYSAGASGWVPGAVSGGSGAAGDYQAFTANGTWTKPAGISNDEMVVVEMWGGGAGGYSSTGQAGGGGGAYNRATFRAADLGATVAVTVGSGGAAGSNGGDSSFGTLLYAYGGGAGGFSAGGGGGGRTSAGSNGASGNGGGPQGGTGGNPPTNSIFGGGGGSSGNSVPTAGASVYGGGGGSAAGASSIGGASVYGGGGGGKNGGGSSVYGGAGGGNGVAGSAPGGGGGPGAAGGRGEVRVWVLPAGSGGGGSTSPGGADTQVQFNDGGSFGGDADFIWNKTSNYLGIGTTPTVALDVVGDINYTGVITDVSDRRFKENITPLENSYDRLMKLNGYSFTMKSDPEHETEYGLIAQEVQPVFPELVKTNADGRMSLNYIGLIAPMVEAMKAQDKRIKALEDKNTALTKRLEALEQAK